MREISRNYIFTWLLPLMLVCNWNWSIAQVQIGFSAGYLESDFFEKEKKEWHLININLFGEPYKPYYSFSSKSDYGFNAQCFIRTRFTKHFDFVLGCDYIYRTATFNEEYYSSYSSVRELSTTEIELHGLYTKLLYEFHVPIGKWEWYLNCGLYYGKVFKGNFDGVTERYVTYSNGWNTEQTYTQIYFNQDTGNKSSLVRNELGWLCNTGIIIPLYNRFYLNSELGVMTNYGRIHGGDVAVRQPELIKVRSFNFNVGVSIKLWDKSERR
ncbi:MAG: outer membrane beta-barrel protein [Crocinitomicaceae bacterium]|nr:outer membrane beta-barrel protein [Crocinitomicaceae bacterium]MBK8927118.1 outer membrane beta-barrel protein [Crocinitomicaceae bacterium]